jgi:DNA-directed RNA polymerase subunit M/transcription elongation factor TFIIS
MSSLSLLNDLLTKDQVSSLRNKTKSLDLENKQILYEVRYAIKKYGFEAFLESLEKENKHNVKMPFQFPGFAEVRKNYEKNTYFLKHGTKRSGFLPCESCGSLNTSVDQEQRNSSDEGATQIIKCFDCDKISKKRA